VLWEPIPSKFIDDGVARRVASGVNFNESDAGFMAMRQDFIAARPDVEKAWLEAELDAQLYLADPKNASEIAKLAAGEAQGYSAKIMWQALYEDHPAAIGGSPDRMALTFVITDQMKAQIDDANAFLFELKRVPAQTLRPEAFADAVARQVLEERKLKSPVGVVKSQPDTAFTQ
jgi:NitT/TauT family transport system substrate-binding protein